MGLTEPKLLPYKVIVVLAGSVLVAVITGGGMGAAYTAIPTHAAMSTVLARSTKIVTIFSVVCCECCPYKAGAVSSRAQFRLALTIRKQDLSTSQNSYISASFLLYISCRAEKMN